MGIILTIWGLRELLEFNFDVFEMLTAQWAVRKTINLLFLFEMARKGAISPETRHTRKMDSENRCVSIAQHRVE